MASILSCYHYFHGLTIFELCLVRFLEKTHEAYYTTYHKITEKVSHFFSYIGSGIATFSSASNWIILRYCQGYLIIWFEPQQCKPFFSRWGYRIDPFNSICAQC